jgi:hypothetical protein
VKLTGFISYTLSALRAFRTYRPDAPLRLGFVAKAKVRSKFATFIPRIRST